MSPPKIFIIIVQYNNSHEVMACLDVVKELDCQNFEIIVVDNKSSEEHYHNIRFYIESQDKLHAQVRPIVLLANAENGGYDGGNNIGIKHALDHGGDYVFILNPDTLVEKDTVSKLLEKMEQDNLGIVGPVSDENGTLTYGGKVCWLKSELSHSIHPMLSDYLPPDMYVPGNALFVKKEVFEKIGFLDERYFLYFDDADFCLRAVRGGFKIAILNNVVVKHAVSTTTSKLGSARLLRYHYRNAHLFNIKFAPWYYKISLPLWSKWIIIKQLAKMVFVPSKRAISQEIFLGVLDFYRRKFGRID